MTIALRIIAFAVVVVLASLFVLLQHPLIIPGALVLALFYTAIAAQFIFTKCSAKCVAHRLRYGTPKPDCAECAKKEKHS